MENKPRKPWVAGLLSFVTIGLGHVYVGEAKKGIFLYFGQSLILTAFLLIFTFKPNIFSLLFGCFIGLAYLFFILVDAVRTARGKSAYYTLKKFNKWYIYLACWFLAGFIIQPLVGSLIKENIIKAYKIPAGSMEPTLLVGDHLLVNTLLYKMAHPQRGDIVVFEYPKDPSKDFVKRLVGMEGDVVEIKNKKLYVNNVEQLEQYVIHIDPKDIPASVMPRDNFGPVTVPPGFLFFMGDNRDNSFDSRFWGFVSNEQVRGKIVNIYWSWDKKTSTVRWGRIGKKV